MPCSQPERRLRNSPDDLAALIGSAAKFLGYPSTWIEIDFWATEALRSLAPPLGDAQVVFKGGTSLSKAHRIIRRMSLDVDIVAKFAKPAGAGTRSSALTGLTDRVVADTGMTSEKITSGKGTHLNTWLYYDSTIGESRENARVLLEMGCRGGTDPSYVCAIRSFIAEYCERNSVSAEFAELEQFQICTLGAERTLLEKLCAVHTLAVNTVRSGKFDPRGLRHFYDVAMLIQDAATMERLGALDKSQVLEDIRQRSLESGWPFEPLPAGGFADSIAFDRTFFEDSRVQAPYSAVLDLVVSGPKPSLAEVAKIVRDKRQSLRG
jgi:hypothetical protein